MMSNIVQLGAKSLALHKAGDGRVAVRMASPVNDVERGLEVILPNFGAAQEYVDYIVDRCPGFYSGAIDMTGEVND
jgi:hypothetical protein